MFVNRERELARLRSWLAQPDEHLALVWGRRRVGKTALLQHLVTGRHTVFHTGAGRPLQQELALLTRALAPLYDGSRDLARRPPADFDDLLDVLRDVWERRDAVLVLDEFPELTRSDPALPGALRAFLDRAPARAKILLAGSAVRSMQALQEERAPLYGRVDRTLHLHPFDPHEAALLLTDLPPAERARVWTLVGGIPLYLRWWDQGGSIAENLGRLVGEPDGRLLLEGQLVLATETETGDLAERVLRAIAAGRTKYSEINDAVRADTGRTLERLVELRLIERLVPVTDDPRRTRRRVYRIADNFLAFWLGVVDRHRTAIDRGLGATVLPAILEALDDHAGPCWEEAFRAHLRRMAAGGHLPDPLVALGRWWRDAPAPVEIDAVGLTGRARTPVLVGEAKWAAKVDGARTAQHLLRRAAAIAGARADLTVAVAARREVTPAPGILAITAADIF